MDYDEDPFISQPENVSQFRMNFDTLYRTEGDSKNKINDINVTELYQLEPFFQDKYRNKYRNIYIKNIIIIFLIFLVILAIFIYY